MVIPVQTRRKMLAAVERGESVVSVARRFEVSERGLRKIIEQCRRRGTLDPLKPGPKKPTKLTPQDDATMLAMIETDPGVTLREMAEALSVDVAESTVCRRLQRLGLSLKKSH